MTMRTSALLACLAVLSVASALAEEPFSVHVIDSGLEVPLGSHPTITIEVRNDSGRPQPIAFMRATVGVEVLSSPGSGIPNSGSLANGDRPVFTDRVPVLAADWVFRTRLTVPVHSIGEHSAVAYFSVREGATKRIGEPKEHWAGRVSSPIFSVRALEPIGGDAEALAFLAAMVPTSEGDLATRFERSLLVPKAQLQLLQRFPESTYAADFIFRGHANHRPWEDNSNLVKILQQDGNHLPIIVPCDHEECSALGSETLEWRDYLLWQNKWFQRIVKHHPDIWYLDDIRFSLAVNHYRLGEKTKCVSELEAIAEGKPSLWASKSIDLLHSLRTTGLSESPTVLKR